MPWQPRQSGHKEVFLPQEKLDACSSSSGTWLQKGRKTLETQKTSAAASLVPRLFPGEKKRPGTICSHMCKLHLPSLVPRGGGGGGGGEETAWYNLFMHAREIP